jgi:HD-GYP domain-containing protein (c-di-GMP phosphodiesterase class II)
MEAFIPMLKSVIREGLFIEITQYLIAILGALAAQEVIWSLGLLLIPVSVTYIAFKNIKEMSQETSLILKDMADTVDLRDMYTGGHSNRVSDLVQQLLIRLKVAGPEATLIEMSARLHDIGKIGIPDAILMKPGTLSVEEMAMMQTHPQKGAELISKYKDFARGASIILHHHERWDGAGYPSGLKGYEIPFGSRLIAVADSFDAMTSDRPYRKALSVHQAIQTLLEGRGTQWEPTIVNALVDMVVSEWDEVSSDHHSQLQGSSKLSQTAFVAS